MRVCTQTALSFCSLNLKLPLYVTLSTLSLKWNLLHEQMNFLALMKCAFFPCMSETWAFMSTDIVK